MSASEVDVVEAAYRVEGRDFGAWAQGVLEAAAGVLDDGMGVALWHVSLSEVRDLGSATRATPPLYLEGAGDLFEQVPLERWRASFGRPVWVGDGIDLLGPPYDAYVRAETERRYGARGIFGCVARASAERSLYLNAPTPREGPPRHDRELWSRVVMHLAAASRLVHRGEDHPADGGEDAVVAPSGTVEHARDDARSPGARQELCEAVRLIDRARTRAGRAEPHRALQLWRGLVDGRWSLVERTESDGRRYYIARRNAPSDSEDARLTHRERQVVALASCAFANAQIAYALGIAEGTVAGHLHRGLEKMGVGSRAELVTLANAGSA